jgi:hypothetical protein
MQERLSRLSLVLLGMGLMYLVADAVTCAGRSCVVRRCFSRRLDGGVDHE